MLTGVMLKASLRALSDSFAREPARSTRSYGLVAGQAIQKSVWLSAGARRWAGRVNARKPIEAEQVREIYRLCLGGHDGNVMGMKAIATHLNRQGLRMRGRRWRIQKIDDLIPDPLYRGCYYFNRRDSRTRKIRPKPEWIGVSIPVIIDAGTFERAAKVARSQTPRMRLPGQPPRLLHS